MNNNLEGVRFMHFRDIRTGGDVSSRGGCTVAYVEVEGGVRYAKAVCSRFDNYNKRQGRVKSSGKLKSDNHSRVFAGNVQQFTQNIAGKQLKAYGLSRKHDRQDPAVLH